jgi:hypothetical protein
MASDAQFKDLAAYQQFVKHELDHGREVNPLSLDNDYISVYDHDDEGRTSYPVLFESEPYTLLREALTLLGIPFEEV